MFQNLRKPTLKKYAQCTLFIHAQLAFIQSFKIFKMLSLQFSTLSYIIFCNRIVFFRKYHDIFFIFINLSNSQLNKEMNTKFYSYKLSKKRIHNYIKFSNLWVLSIDTYEINSSFQKKINVVVRTLFFLSRKRYISICYSQWTTSIMNNWLSFLLIIYCKDICR